MRNRKEKRHGLCVKNSLRLRRSSCSNLLVLSHDGNALVPDLLDEKVICELTEIYHRKQTPIHPFFETKLTIDTVRSK
jgi:hypothetical protein